MSKGLEVEIKVIEKEFLKFKAEYEKLEKEVKNKGLNINLNNNELRNFNYNILDVSQTLLSISSITNSLKPISEVLGIKDLRPLTNGIVGIANGLNMVKTASTAVGASLGWISIATSALAFLINNLKDTKKELDGLTTGEEDYVELLQKKYEAEERLEKARNGWYFSEKKRQDDIFKIKKEILELDELATLAKERDRENSKGSSSGGSAKKEGLSKASQVYADIGESFKDLKTKLNLGIITLEEFAKESLAVKEDLLNKIKENGAIMSRQNREEAEKAKNEAEANEKLAKETQTKNNETLQLLTEATFDSLSSFGRTLINNMQSFIDGDLNESLEALSEGAVEFADKMVQTMLMQFLENAVNSALPGAQAIKMAVKMIWDFLTAIFFWWRGAQKKNREEEKKRQKEDFEKKKKADIEALKEKREAEKELLKKENKVRQENIKRLEKDLDIFESAFSRGAIGLSQYIAEIEETLRRKQEEQDAIDTANNLDKLRDKQTKSYIEYLNNRSFGAPMPQSAPQNANVYSAPQNASSNYNNNVMNSNSNVRIDNINITAVIDPNNKNSLKELSIQILEEFKKLKIQGKFEGV